MKKNWMLLATAILAFPILASCGSTEELDPASAELTSITLDVSGMT